MKALTEADLKICRFQAELFEASIEKCSQSSAIFIRRFMNSRIAEQIDKGYLLQSSLDIQAVLDEVEAEYGPSSYGKTKLPANVMHWIGYLYRYWNIATEMSSKRIYKIANAKTMNKLYPSYHTLSPDAAVERILDANGAIYKEEDLITEGVRYLKQLRQGRAT